MGQLEEFEKGNNGASVPSAPLGLKGKTPPTRNGALSTSQLHAQGAGADYSVLAKHSIHDLDGKTPNAYQKPADTSGNF